MAAFAFAPVAAHGQGDAATSTGVTMLRGDVLHGLRGLTPVGRVSPDRPIYVGIGLSREDPAGENAYLKAVYDPANPIFHQFLDSVSFENRFGVPLPRYAATLAWLHGGELTTRAIPGTRDYILATGTAARVERLFRVALNEYSYQGQRFYANDSPPTVPASLGVLGVAGLQDWAHPRLVGQQPGRPAALKTGSTTPQDLWSIYHQPGDNQGQGQSIAVFGWGLTDGVQLNLDKFETRYKLLGKVPLDIHHYGQGTITDNSGLGEWLLDTTATVGMAPAVDFERLYFGVTGLDPDMIAAYNAWDGDSNGPRQGSSSFAGCEEAPGTDGLGGGPGNPPGTVIAGNPNQDLYEAALKKAVGLGRTMFASTGDIGGNGCPAVNLVLNGVTLVPTQVNTYPAVSQYVVAVGGTVLYWNDGPPSTRALEYSWTHTGGGSSFFVAAGDYQGLIPAPGLLARCIVDGHGNPYSPAGPPCRGIPDVAAQSGDLLGNGYVSGGGTSLSAPLWNGMWTRIQAASSNPAGTGFANPLIYTNNADATKYARDFLDIGGISTQTAITCNGPDGPYHCSHPGWDYVSGWGAPDVSNLMLDLVGKTNPVSRGHQGQASPSPTQPSPAPAASSTPAPLPNTSGSQGGHRYRAVLVGLLILAGAILGRKHAGRVA
ncbi:MAG: S53 family peptidase [Candidatus Dormibacteria bacterium]